MKRIFIVNPVATQCPPDLAARISRTFPDARVWVTEQAGDATRMARRAVDEGFANSDRIVACGGDGTFREVAEIVGGRVPVGIIPVGTVNLVARNLEIPLNVAGALAVLERDVSAEIFPGRCVLDGGPEGRLFFIAVSIGPDADAAHAVGVVGKRVLGRYVYPLQLALRLARPVKPDVNYEEDGVTGSCGELVALRMPVYGGSYRISEHASLFQPNLDVVTAESGRLRVLRLFWDAYRSRVTPRSGIRRETVTTLRVRVSGEGRIQIDGDPFVAHELTVTAESESLTVVAGASG